MIPKWLHPLRDMISEEAFGEVTGVQLLNTSATDSDLRYLADVPTVERVWPSDTKVTKKGLPYLHACPKLKFLALNNPPITDDCLTRLPARVPDDDHAFGIDDDRLPEAELLERRRDRIHGRVVDPRVAEVGFDPINGPEFDAHGRQ